MKNYLKKISTILIMTLLSTNISILADTSVPNVETVSINTINIDSKETYNNINTFGVSMPFSFEIEDMSAANVQLESNATYAAGTKYNPVRAFIWDSNNNFKELKDFESMLNDMMTSVKDYPSGKYTLGITDPEQTSNIGRFEVKTTRIEEPWKNNKNKKNIVITAKVTCIECNQAVEVKSEREKVNDVHDDADVELELSDSGANVAIYIEDNNKNKTVSSRGLLTCKCNQNSHLIQTKDGKWAYTVGQDEIADMFVQDQQTKKFKAQTYSIKVIPESDLLTLLPATNTQGSLWICGGHKNTKGNGHYYFGTQNPNNIQGKNGHKPWIKVTDMISQDELDATKRARLDEYIDEIMTNPSSSNRSKLFNKLKGTTSNIQGLTLNAIKLKLAVNPSIKMSVTSNNDQLECEGAFAWNKYGNLPEYGSFWLELRQDNISGNISKEQFEKTFINNNRLNNAILYEENLTTHTIEQHNLQDIGENFAFIKLGDTEEKWGSKVLIKPKEFNKEYAYWFKVFTPNGLEYETSKVKIKVNEPEAIKAIELTATANQAENYIDLKWNAPSTSTFYNYTVLRKDQTSDEFQSVGSIDIDAYKQEGKKIKVLNIYPTNGVTKINYKGGQIYKSANLKPWMEDPQTGAPDGYGQGVLSVAAVSITDFNRNPSIINNYDVAYMGHWDSNANQGLTSNALWAVKTFINEGRGFLVGHDTTAADILDNGTQFSLGGSPELRAKFNIKTGRSIDVTSPTALVTSGKIDFNNKFNWGGSQIEIAKTGALMNYPWVIKNPLTVPTTHTAAQIAYGDVWFTFKNGNWYSGRNNSPTASQLNGGALNFYLTTWNNTGIIQTGHSNGNATPDEQKILANALFYLAQKTTATNLTDKGGQDTTPPTQSQVNNVQIDSSKKVKINFSQAEDQGTTYTYKVKAADINNAASVVESQEATATIKVGLKGYIAVASNIADLASNDLKIMKANETGVVTVDASSDATSAEINSSDLNLDLPIYIYLASVDNVNNVSEPFKYVYNSEQLTLTSTQRQGDKGDKWVDLTWTKPEWLGNYKLYRDGEFITSSGTTYEDKSDEISPKVPENISVVYNNGKVTTEFLPAKDVEASHTYKITASNTQGRYESTTGGTVMSGIKGYKISIDNSPDTKPSGDIIDNLPSIGDKLQWVSSELGSGFNPQGAYIHITSVDNKGNESETMHIKLDVGYPEVKLTVINPTTGKAVLESYAVDTTGPNYKEKILSPAAIVGKEEAISLEIKLDQLESQRYQFIEKGTSDIKPSFPENSNSNWKDINTFEYSYQVGEAEWSKVETTTSGDLNALVYDHIKINANIAMPTDTGNYYLALKVQPKGGNPPREVLYGPFAIIKSVSPEITSNLPKNFTLPEGYSNIDYDVKFDADYKDVKITLDMDQLINMKVSDTRLMLAYNLKQAIFTINSSGVSRIIKLKDVGGSYSDPDYQISIGDQDGDGVDDKIIITLLGEIPAEKEYNISALISTKFNEKVEYGPKEVNGTYLNLIDTIGSKEVTAIIEGKPKLQEATDEAPAKYRVDSVETSEPWSVNYRPMSKIH